MTSPYVRLMGRPGIQSHGGWFEFMPEKRYRLLAYLAYAGEWVSRDQLAYLFWPRAVTQTARGNLRSLLERARDVTWLTGLETERHRVRWLVASDVAALQAALDHERYPARDPQIIVTLYTGRLLDGLDSYDESEFGNWLELEREHLYGRWREGMLRQVELSIDRAGTRRAAGDQAFGLLEVVLSHDGLDEEVVRLYLELATDRQRRDRGLRIYQEFSKRLHRELGLQPAASTQQLARQAAEEGDEDPRPPGVTVAAASDQSASHGGHWWPAASATFVGRRAERDDIARLLARADCRLVTLTGTGGVGKTRLALHAAGDLLEEYADGCCFVSLESTSLHGAIASRIAEELRVEPGPEPLANIMAYLADKRLLLVLDNFEHLIEAADLLPELIARCPQVDLIVTSRERLNLAEEWLVLVEGLRFPSDAEVDASAAPFDAVELFVQRAQRHAPRWVPSAEDASHVRRICNVLEGNPLAIELSAVWVRFMACSDIVLELQEGIDFLTASPRNATQRHASIRATFEYSWRLLTPVEQDALRWLSVFRGGTTREASAVVASVPVAVLAALVDKSLLRLAPNGRYDRHPLLYQYGRQKLAEEPEHEARLQKRHAEYYFRLLIEWGAKLQGPQRERAMRAIRRDLDNILTAWRWAITTVQVRELQQATAPLHQFFALQDRGREGAEVFAEMVGALRDADPHHRAALGYALVSHGFFLDRRDPNRMKVLQRGLALLRPAHEGTGVMWGLYVLGLSAVWTGDRDGARRFFNQTLLLATQEDDPRTRGDCLSNLARLLQDGGDYTAAIRYASEAVTVWQSLRDPHGEVWALIWWGLSALRLGRLQEAEDVMERAFDIARASHDTLQASLLTAHRGLAAHARGDLPRARDLHLEAIELVQGTLEGTFTKPMYLADLGRIECALGRESDAEARFVECLEMAVPNRWLAHLLSAFAGLAALRSRQGEHGTALVWAFLVLQHVATEWVHHDQMQALIDELRTVVPEADVATCLERSKGLRLEDVAQELIRRRPLRA